MAPAIRNGSSQQVAAPGESLCVLRNRGGTSTKDGPAVAAASIRAKRKDSFTVFSWSLRRRGLRSSLLPLGGLLTTLLPREPRAPPRTLLSNAEAYRAHRS
jgi:hypothetical protein